MGRKPVALISTGGGPPPVDRKPVEVVGVGEPEPVEVGVAIFSDSFRCWRSEKSLEKRLEVLAFRESLENWVWSFQFSPLLVPLIEFKIIANSIAAQEPAQMSAEIFDRICDRICRSTL